MYKEVIYHIDQVDDVKAQREDDKLLITVLNGDEALLISIDPEHFGALRKAMDMAEARNADSIENKLHKPGDL